MAQKRKLHRSGELDAFYFDKLPQRCKEMFFEFLSCEFQYDGDKAFFVDVEDFCCDDCKSPIEQIFKFAFDIIAFTRNTNPISVIPLTSQAEIILNNHNYIADFLFDSDELEKEINPYKLVIECDGHEFHEKTKEQVKKDNQRDYDLKLAGYDVLHFSGSQIYNEPFKCAEETYDYILSKITK